MDPKDETNVIIQLKMDDNNLKIYKIPQNYFPEFKGM